MNNIITGIVLAAAAGLNAFLPILALAVGDRISDSVNLDRPFNVISTPAGFLVLLVLVTLELVMDKIPNLQRVNEVLGYVVRPAAGAFLFMAMVEEEKSGVATVLALVFGLLIGGSVHVLKTRARSDIPEATRGALTPVISMVEDGVAFVVPLVTVLLPILGAILAVASAIFLGWFYRKLPAMGMKMQASKVGASRAGSKSSTGTGV